MGWRIPSLSKSAQPPLQIRVTTLNRRWLVQLSVLVSKEAKPVKYNQSMFSADHKKL